MNEKKNEWMNKWKNEWINEWMNEWMNKWMNELINEWIIQKHFIAMTWKRKENNFFLNWTKKNYKKLVKMNESMNDGENEFIENK